MNTTVRRSRVRRAFSMIELLIALSISGMLLSACLVALDSSFKSYEVTTESASTHVVSRMVMHRALAMIRSGESFGPYPVGVIVPTKITSDYIEFVTARNDAAAYRQITRLEKVADGVAGVGFFQLMYKRWEYTGAAQTSFVEYPLIRNLRAATFTLEYDRGPKLRRATVDLTIKPDDDQAVAVSSALEANVIRLIASASPRRLDP
ncbi:MAG: PilW family protein [Phycisphaerales bacterium]